MGDAEGVTQHIVVPAEDGHEIEVSSEPWYHPHHIMHHGDKIFGSIVLLLIACIGHSKWKKHRKVPE